MRELTRKTMASLGFGQDSLANIYLVWLRHFALYRRSWIFGLTTTISEPLLILFAFGFGLGGMIGTIDIGDTTLTYRQFVFAGIAAQSALLQGYFEGSYGSFIRMYYQKIFHAIAVTPITLSELLWAEIIWDSTRAAFASSVILIIGALIGDFAPTGCLLAFPLLLAGSLLFASMGVFSAALAKTINELSYPHYLIAIPMFLLCGVFFPVSQMPEWLQPIIYFLPLTNLVDTVRSVTLGLSFPWWGLLRMLCWTVLFVLLARRAMTKRLVN